MDPLVLPPSPAPPPLPKPDPNLSQPVLPAKKSFPKWPFLALFTFFLGIGSVFAYQKLQSNPPTGSLPVASSPSPIADLPSPDPTAGWETYTNLKYNYSFKYPSDNVLAESGMSRDNLQNSPAISVFSSDDKAENQPRFSITVMNDDLSLQAIASNHFQNLSHYQMTAQDREAATKNLGFPIIDPVILKSLTQSSFNNLPAYTYKIQSNVYNNGAGEGLIAQATYNYLWVQLNQQFYLITFTDTASNHLILSTFKFTD